jgi:CRISPR-associated protein Cst1
MSQVKTKQKQLFTLTGNPFVDAGLAVLSAYNEKEITKLTKADLKKSLEYISKIYDTKKWRSALHAQIFPNIEIFNPSVRKSDPERYKRKMAKIIEVIEPLKDHGNCIICGSRNGKPQIRMRIPMLGSRKMVNYFPHGQKGESICPGCIFAVQFIPLYIVKVGNPLLLQSSVFEIMRSFANKQLQKHEEKFLQKKYDGLIESDKKGLNTIFDIVEEIASSYQRFLKLLKNEIDQKILDNPYLTFYHFSNYNQTDPNTALAIYHFPNTVYRFIRVIINQHLEKEWFKIVIKGFDKKEDQKDPEKAFKKRVNSVYKKLIDGESITGYFFDRENYQLVGSWSLLELYLKLVKEMNQETIDLIKELGDRIVEVVETDHNVRRVKELDRAKSYRVFRTTLLKFAKKWVTTKPDEPLLTVDDYLQLLFYNEMNNWSEIRDLLLLRFLETASKELLNEFIGVEIEENDEEDE